MINFRIANTLGDPRGFLSSADGIRSDRLRNEWHSEPLPGGVIEPAIGLEQIYQCSERSGQGILAALWIATNILARGESRVELEPWIQVASKHLPARSTERRRWLNSGSVVKSWVRNLLGQSQSFHRECHTRRNDSVED